MKKCIIRSSDEFQEQVGLELGISDFHTVTQTQIDLFANATMDYQWIHVDIDRATNESQFGKTIAHGYLNLSILPYLLGQFLEVQNTMMMVNYGIEKLKFISPVTVDSEVRAKARLDKLTNLRGITKAEINVVLEIKDVAKPAMDAMLIFLYYFN